MSGCAGRVFLFRRLPCADGGSMRTGSGFCSLKNILSRLEWADVGEPRSSGAIVGVRGLIRGCSCFWEGFGITVLKRLSASVVSYIGLRFAMRGGGAGSRYGDGVCPTFGRFARREGVLRRRSGEGRIGRIGDIPVARRCGGRMLVVICTRVRGSDIRAGRSVGRSGFVGGPMLRGVWRRFRVRTG